MIIDLALVVWFAGSLLFLFAVEVLTVVLHVPTISERVQALGRRAAVLVLWVTFSLGLLVDHFFGH